MFISNQSRGIRNNNPLNIRRTSSQWKGLVEVPTDDRWLMLAEAMAIHENGTSSPDHFAMLQG